MRALIIIAVACAAGALACGSDSSGAGGARAADWKSGGTWSYTGSVTNCPILGGGGATFSANYTGTMNAVATPAGSGATFTGTWQHTMSVVGGGSGPVSGTLTGSVNATTLTLVMTGLNGTDTLTGSATSNPTSRARTATC